MRMDEPKLERNVQYSQGNMSCKFTIDELTIKIIVSSLPVQGEITILNVTVQGNGKTIELEREEKELFYSKISELFPYDTDIVVQAITERINVANVRFLNHCKSRYDYTLQSESGSPQEAIQLYNKMLAEYTVNEFESIWRWFFCWV